MKRALHIIGVVVALVALAHAQTVPTGFVDEELASGFSEPVGMDIASDERIFLISQNGWIKVVAQGAVGQVGNVPNLLGIAATGSSHAGLLGIAVDPGWPTRPFIYCFWTYSTPRSRRISRFTLTGDLTIPTSVNLTLGTEFPIVTDIQDTTSVHPAGCLRFGPDGMLYASIGDDFAFACNAQDITDHLGTILRLDVSGLPLTGSGPAALSALVPAGNPFAGPNDHARLIWSYGLRNPFRFTVDAQSGDLFIGDVGTQDYEEIHRATAGGENFGWPWFEGPLPHGSCGPTPPPTVGPIAVIDRSLHIGAASIIPLVLYRNQPGGIYNFGPAYEGNFLYADFWAGFVRRIEFDGISWNPTAPVSGQPNPDDWATNVTHVPDAMVGPDGAIYYLRRWPGISLRRIRGTPGTLSVVSGNSQTASAETPLWDPLVVAVQAGSGFPASGVPVTFTITTGSGALGPQPILTDSLGHASTTVTLAAAPAVNAQVTAEAAGASPATFDITWRGLEVDFNPITSTLSVDVTHSQTSSPLILAIDTPQPVGIPTSSGQIFTSILSPLPSLIVLDGMGLLGPPNPAMVTGAPQPTWSLVLPNIPPLGGQIYTFQVYVVDTTLLPHPSGILITNAVNVTF